MITPPSHARAYRRLGYLALTHAVALVALTGFLLRMQGSEHEFWLRRLYVGLVTLWFLWPIVLALHPGRSVLRLGVFALLSAILLWPSLRFYNIFAPMMFGFPEGADLNPLSAWTYFNAYRTGRADAEKDVAAGTLAIEEYGFGAGYGPYVELLCERYQIEIRPVAACIVNERILGHAAGYNKVSEREIDQRVGSDRVRATREEGYRLAAEQREREEHYFKDLARRLSTFSSDSKIALESVQPWADGRREISAEAEQELGQFVRAIEKFVAEVIPQDIAALELHVSATLTPTEPPRFETSSSLSCPRPVYEEIYNGLPNLPLPQWDRGTLEVALHFTVRETH